MEDLNYKIISPPLLLHYVNDQIKLGGPIDEDYTVHV